MARPRRTRRPAKRRVEKELPELHENYYNLIKFYKETNVNYNILAGNMFQNYFLISY